jgi:hypothetical protein
METQEQKRPTRFGCKHTVFKNQIGDTPLEQAIDEAREEVISTMNRFLKAEYIDITEHPSILFKETDDEVILHCKARGYRTADTPTFKGGDLDKYEGQY